MDTWPKIVVPWESTTKSCILNAYVKEAYGKQDILISRFYRSGEWKIARASKIATADGWCEKIDAIGVEVYHIIHLAPENVVDPEISLNHITYFLRWMS